MFESRADLKFSSFMGASSAQHSLRAAGTEHVMIPRKRRTENYPNLDIKNDQDLLIYHDRF